MFYILELTKFLVLKKNFNFTRSEQTTITYLNYFLLPLERKLIIFSPRIKIIS